MAIFSSQKKGEKPKKKSEDTSPKPKKSRKSGKRQFVLTIGDEGAILVLHEGNKLVKRLFVTSPSSEDFLRIVSSSPKTPLYVLIDVIDQAYTQHTLPPVSPISIGRLVKRKLAKDFEEEDITQALSLGREKVGRKDWKYLFVSLRYVPPFSEWIEVIAELPNRLRGIYLLPIESKSYLNDLRKLVFIEKSQKQSKWQILVSHNRVGGFRQVIYKDNAIIFTRIAQPIGGTAPDVIAGNIEQETLNTIEYIRRLGYQDEDGLDIFVVASEEVRKALENNSLTANAFAVITPFEVATQLGLENAAEPTDRYGDVVFASYFASSKKHVLKFHTPYTQKLETIGKMRLFSRMASGITAIALLAYSGYTYPITKEIEKKIALAQITKQDAEVRLSQVKKFESEFTENPDRIKDIARLNTMLTKDQYSPLDFIDKYTTIRGFDAYVSIFRMMVTERTDAENRTAANFDVVFYNPTNSSLDRLLEDIDIFTDDVQRKFRDYRVKFSGLPDEEEMVVDFGESSRVQSLVFQIEMEGPIVINTATPKPGAI